MADSPVEEVQLLVLDVDGVMTDGLIHIDANGVETKTFNVRDGLGLRLWMRLGYKAAIITGRSSMTVQHRATELGIRHVFQGVRDKRRALGDVLEATGLMTSQTAVMGDDLADLPMMKLAGYPVAVADAAPEVHSIASFITTQRGGYGAVRETVERLLKAQGRWEDALAVFGSPL